MNMYQSEYGVEQLGFHKKRFPRKATGGAGEHLKVTVVDRYLGGERCGCINERVPILPRVRRTLSCPKRAVRDTQPLEAGGILRL